MSQAVRVAVATLLTTDAGLKALLAPNPLDAALPAVFNARKVQVPPVYDCLTYRVTQSVPDARFEPPIPCAPGQGGTGDGDIEDVYIDFEAWSQQADSAPIEAIGARLKALFGNAAFDAPPDGRIFKSHRVMAETDLYHPQLNCWFGLFRFRLRLQRRAPTEAAEPDASPDAIDTNPASVENAGPGASVDVADSR